MAVNYGQGNIDLNSRPVVKNSDGSISTVRSISISQDGKEILIPTVVNGKVVSNQEAINNYNKTGQYLGKFNTVDEANKYAEQLHKDQQNLYNNKNMALDSTQITGLDVLSKKISEGYTPNETDTANLNYGKGQGYVYKPTPQLPSVVANMISPIQDTTKILETIKPLEVAAKTADEQAIADANLSRDNELANYKATVANVDTKTAEDLAAIEQAGTSAGAGYDNLIADAQSNKAQGTAKAIIGAGRRGGFMNTLESGQAALGPTDSFAGAGGKIEALKSAYDRNINQLQIAKNNAIASAKAAKTEAIRSGKKEDVQMALDLYNVAKEIANKAEELNQQRLDNIAKAQTESNRSAEADRKFALDVAQFQDSQDRFDQTQSVAQGWLDRSLTQDEMKSAQDNISKMADGGIPLNQLKPEEITALEAQAGFEPGTFEAIYQKLYDSARMGETTDSLQLQKLMADTAKAKRLAVGGGSGSGTSGSGTSGTDTKDTKAFYDDINTMMNDLSLGKKSWGQAFNYMKSKYGAPDDVLDTLMDKTTWSTPGAYETKKKERAATSSGSTDELIAALEKLNSN